MVVSDIYFRSDSTYRHNRLSALMSDAQMITEKDGILIAIIAFNPDTTPTHFLKLYNKKTLVTPDSDDPDWQLLMAVVPSYRIMRFDPSMGAFAGGLQIAASDTSGPSASDPSTGFSVDVYWQET